MLRINHLHREGGQTQHIGNPLTWPLVVCCRCPSGRDSRAVMVFTLNALQWEEGHPYIPAECMRVCGRPVTACQPIGGIPDQGWPVPSRVQTPQTANDVITVTENSIHKTCQSSLSDGAICIDVIEKKKAETLMKSKGDESPVINNLSSAYTAPPPPSKNMTPCCCKRQKNSMDGLY